MARCKSWRYTTVPTHQGHLPGKCRDCWAPCTQQVDPGVVRCRDCLVAILSNPDTKVRRGLFAEDDLSEEMLELLSDDPNPVLAATARTRLAGMRDNLSAESVTDARGGGEHG